MTALAVVPGAAVDALEPAPGASACSLALLEFEAALRPLLDARRRDARAEAVREALTTLRGAIVRRDMVDDLLGRERFDAPAEELVKTLMIRAAQSGVSRQTMVQMFNELGERGTFR